MLYIRPLVKDNLPGIASQMNNGISEEELLEMIKEDHESDTCRIFIMSGTDSWMFVEEQRLEKLLLEIIRFIDA